MTGEINWALITNGSQFEALVHTLLFHSDPKTRLSGRPGRDRGIDAKSGDLKTVYQAKYHQVGNITNIISDAKSEYSKIKEYRKKEHSNYNYWKDVTKWVLATNIAVNETDKTLWDNEIIPLFNQDDIIPELWDKRILDIKLGQNLNIIHHFFGGKNRAVISLTEAYDLINARSLIKDIVKIDDVGLKDNINKFKLFLKDDDKKILPVIGKAGAGKTYFLYKCGIASVVEEPDRLVYWALTEELDNSDWFDALPPGSKCLLIIDEPENVSLIKRIYDQLGGIGTLQWKILISARKTKKHIVDILQREPYEFINDVIKLEELTEDETKILINSAIDFIGINNINRERVIDVFTSDIFFRTPFWIFLGLSLLKKRGNLQDLPKESSKYIEAYIDEVIKDSNESSLYKNILYWISLYNELNIEDNNVVGFILNETNCTIAEFEESLKTLKDKGILINKGLRKRIFEVKPDIIRDYFIQSYLLNDDSILSQKGNLLINNLVENKIPVSEALLKTLSYAEYFLTKDISLLEPVFDQLKKISSERNDASNLYGVVRLLSFIARNDIDKSLQIFRTIIDKHAITTYKIEIIYGQQEIGYFEVTRDIPWIVFSQCAYAIGKEESILYFMKDLVLKEYTYTENEKAFLRTAGKSAKSLFGRIISSEFFSFHYHSAAIHMCNEYITKINENKQINENELDFIKLLFASTFVIERNIHSSSPKKDTVTWEKRFVSDSSKIWKARIEINRNIKKILSDKKINEPNKLFVWDIFSEMHRQINIAVGHVEKRNENEKYINTLAKEMEDNLLFVRDMMKSNFLSRAEKIFAREVWDWHHQFEKQFSELKDLAVECEKFYLGDKVLSQFQILISGRNKTFELENVHNEIVEDVLQGGKETLEKLIRNYKLFKKDTIFHISVIARRLGKKVFSCSFLKDFIFDYINTSDTIYHPFIIEMINGLLHYLRSEKKIEECISFQNELLEKVSDKNKLLHNIYIDTRPFNTGLIQKDELNYIVGLIDKYVDDPFVFSTIISGLFYIDWKKCAAVFDKKFSTIPINDKTKCYTKLVENIFTLTLFEKQLHFIINNEIRDWLFNKLQDIPDFDKIDGLQYDFDELIKKTGPLSMAWLKKLLQKRRELENKYKDDEDIVSPIPQFFKISKWILFDKTSSNDINILNEILSLNSFHNFTGYYLPELICKVADGESIASIIVSKINNSNIDDIPLWVRFAKQYKKNSKIWRIIAIAALKRITHEPGKIERDRIFGFLQPDNSRSWTGAPGKVAGFFYNDVSKAQKNLEEEKDPYLKAFWEWDLKVATQDLEFEKQRLEEE